VYSVGRESHNSHASSRLRCHSTAVLFALPLLVLSAAIQVQAQNAAVPPEFVEATQAMHEGRIEEAAAGFAATVRRQPGFAEGHFNLGLADEELGKYNEAVASLRQALKLKPHLRGADLFLGIAEFRLNNLETAAAAMERETAAYPKDATAWMWLGVVRLAQERAEDAEPRKGVGAPMEDLRHATPGSLVWHFACATRCA